MWATIGWGIATFLLQWLIGGRSSSSDSSSEQQPSKFTESNANQIGSPVPVVLGRALIKNPLISYYGDFDYKPYTEEYGMHSELDASSLLWPILLGILASVIIPTVHSTNDTDSHGDSGFGTAQDNQNGIRNGIIVYAVLNILIAMLMWLFNRHAGRTTIQKGFLYYLGWQHIICWTGDNIGIKKLWMNVYDPNVKESTNKGVWDNSNRVAWKKDNPNGVSAYINDIEMFGGYDEGGGFVGYVRFYFGTQSQGKDPWMVAQMSSSSNIPSDLKGLTPVYPMYFTCVIPKAYIGKQATIPEMWFEVVNYPSRLTDTKKDQIKYVYFKDIKIAYEKLLAYIDGTPNTFKQYMETYHKAMQDAFDAYEEAVEKLVNSIETYEVSKNRLIKEIADLNVRLQDATNIRNSWVNNKNSRYNDLVNKKNKLEAEKVSTIANKQAAYDQKKDAYAQQLDESYKEYQAALATGDQDKIADSLASYNLLVAQSNADLTATANDITTTENNYDVNIANTQAEIDNFDADYDAKLLDYDAAISAINDLIAQAQQSLLDLENGASASSSDVDVKFEAFKDSVNVAISNLTTYYVDPYTNAASKLTNLFNIGTYTLSNIIGADLNPAEAIYEILKNELWGCDYSDDRIDIYSLLKLGETLQREGLGVSCLINQVNTAGNYIQKILEHVNGICYDDPVTGKLTFKLIRPDYVLDDLLTFNPSNCVNMKFTRLDWSQTKDRVSATFTSADTKYNDATLTVFDIANNRITHNVNEEKIDASYFTTPQGAQVFAQTVLLTAAYPLAAINFECNRYGYLITLGDPIIVSWKPYGIEKQVFRVTDIDYSSLQSGNIKVTAIEDVYGFDATTYKDVDTITWTEPVVEPSSIVSYFIFEPPYELSDSIDTNLWAYIYRPDMEVVYYNLWRYLNYTYVNTIRTQTFAYKGKLLYALPRAYDILGDVEIFVKDYSSNSLFEHLLLEVEEGTRFTSNRAKACAICIDKEILAYDTIDRAVNGNIILHNVRRGLLDTVPHEHLSNSEVYFLELYLDYGNGNYVCQAGNTVVEDFGFTTETMSKAEDFDETKTHTYETIRRSERPSIMHNLQFGCDRGDYTIWKHYYTTMDVFSGDMVFKFNTRNKFNDTSLFGQDDDTYVDVEESTQYYIKLYSNDKEHEFLFDAVDNGVSINNVAIHWDEFCSFMEDSLKIDNEVIFDAGTYNKELELCSYDHYHETFNYHIPQVIGILNDSATIDDDVKDYFDSCAYQERLIVMNSDINASIALDILMGALVLVGEEVSDPITAWEGNTKYTVNERVMYNNTIYICIKDHTSDSLSFTRNSADWQVVPPTITPEEEEVVMIGNGDIKYHNIKRAFMAIAVDEFDHVEYKEVELGQGYVLRNNFTHEKNLKPVYFKYVDDGVWDHFSPTSL